MQNIQIILKQLLQQNKKFEAIHLYFLISGFILGNLFGINSNLIFWNGFCIFAVVLVLEIINGLNSKFFLTEKKIFKEDSLYVIQKNTFIFYLNLMKRGFLLGIFLEAFKVGS